MENEIDTEKTNTKVEIEEPKVSIESETKLSKKQQKKLAKREKWIEQKAARRAEEKRKRRLKLEEYRKNGKDLGPSRKMLKANKMSESSCQLKIVFDLSLDVLMTESELSKTLKQLHRCYSMNRRAAAPLQLYINGFSKASKETLTKLNFLNWDVHMNEEKYLNNFPKDTITYLTSDSPNALETLDHSKVYIIGALVDHNRLKNICYENAEKSDVAHAKLPLDDYIDMKTRKVLTIDQVYLILLRVTEGMTWEQAFIDILPKRKGAVVKNTNDSSSS